MSVAAQTIPAENPGRGAGRGRTPEWRARKVRGLVRVYFLRRYSGAIMLIPLAGGLLTWSALPPHPIWPLVALPVLMVVMWPLTLVLCSVLAQWTLDRDTGWPGHLIARARMSEYVLAATKLPEEAIREVSEYAVEPEMREWLEELKKSSDARLSLFSHRALAVASARLGWTGGAGPGLRPAPDKTQTPEWHAVTVRRLSTAYNFFDPRGCGFMTLLVLAGLAFVIGRFTPWPVMLPVVLLIPIGLIAYPLGACISRANVRRIADPVQHWPAHLIAQWFPQDEEEYIADYREEETMRRWLMQLARSSDPHLSAMGRAVLTKPKGASDGRGSENFTCFINQSATGCP